MLQSSYSPNYFSLDDILATQEKLPSTFNIDLPGLGILSEQQAEEGIKAGTKLEIPFWLAEDLGLKKPAMISCEMPKIFKDNYLEIFKADPCIVDLHRLKSNFYNFGLHAQKFDKTRSINQMILETFKGRFRLIFDLAQNIEAECLDIHKLDNLEHGLFEAGHKAQVFFNHWLISDNIKTMEAAEMVVNHKKRKQTQMIDI